MELGISSYTYGWAVGVPGYASHRPMREGELLDCASRHGVKVLQIGDNLPLESFDEGRLEALAARAASARLALEVGARRLTGPRLERYARIARRIGARLVRFVVDDEDHHPTPNDVIGILRDAAPSLMGLTIAIENHDRFSAAELRGIIEAVDSEGIGICLDTANSLGAGEGVGVVVPLLAPLTVNLHLKDFQIARLPHRMGFTVEGRAAGAGMLGIPWVLGQLEPFGRCRTAVVELWTPPELDMEQTLAKEEAWAARSLEYLKPLFITRP